MSSLTEVPPHVPAELVVDFDHRRDCPALNGDPLGLYIELARQHRMFYSPHHGGFWVATRHEDIHEIYTHPELWSSRYVSIPSSNTFQPLPISLDPPEHAVYRRLINPVFSPPRVQALEGPIRAMAVELIDRISQMDECDFVTDFAKPLPARLFARMFGLPAEEWKRFVEWDDMMVREDLSVRMRVTTEVRDYLKNILDDRKVNRGDDDIISIMLDSQIDGQPLTDEELLNMAFQLFAAGFDTVTTSLVFAFRHLAMDPALRERIVNDLSLVPTAVEELLRINAIAYPSRTATQDQIFAGLQIKEGDRVLLLTTPAGREEAEYPHATEVDLERGPTRHLTFGAGPHRCIGSHLARTEITIAIEEWHRRIPNYQIAEGSGQNSRGGGAPMLTDLRIIIGH